MMLDSTHHRGLVVGTPPCLVVDRRDAAAGHCSADGIYWVTVTQGRTRFAFGACVEHTALLRSATDRERPFVVESVSNDHPYREREAATR